MTTIDSSPIEPAQSKMKPPTMPTLPTAAANGFLKFADASPTPFHAVHTATQRLVEAGFTRVSERDDWRAKWSNGQMARGGKYFYTRNQSSLVAFALPTSKHVIGLSAVAGHTDSPVIKLRPVSNKVKGSALLAATEIYGGGIWATWFDRDLSLAGRVIIQDSDKQSTTTTFSSKLVKIDKPLLRIPTLAIHLDRTINENWKFNKEEQLRPIMGMVASTVNAPSTSEPSKPSEPSPLPSASSRHSTVLLDLLASELSVPVSHIHDFELLLYDTQKGTTSGLSNEFLHTARIDNLMTCFTAVEGLVESTLQDQKAQEENQHVRAVCLFDNEEVGSVSYAGADSDMLPTLIENLLSIPSFTSLSAAQFYKNSFLISSDQGHALHPNYESKYQESHAPLINGGVIIKTNANQRYTSNAHTTFLVRLLAERASQDTSSLHKGELLPLQEFEVRNDVSCGSTVGPMLSSRGVRTVDIGSPQWGMHSIRETAGTKDPEYLVRLFETFFSHFTQVDKQLVLD